MHFKQKLLWITLILSCILLFTFYHSLANIHKRFSKYHYEDVHHAYRSESITPENLADFYFIHTEGKPSGINKTCAKFPKLFDIRFHNDHWQIQKTTEGIFHLFSAYIDSRVDMVRILTMYDVYPLNRTFYCQFWYLGESEPVIYTTDKPLRIFSKGWGGDKPGLNQPYLITCPLEKVHGKIPLSVSIVEDWCDNATNNVKINYKKVEEKKGFVVCVKGLSFYFEDNSVRIAEWIELVRLLGAEKINFYKFGVDSNTDEVLQLYEDKGLVEVTPMSLVGDFSNNPILQSEFLHKNTVMRRLQEVIPYNDCLYKHLQEFQYVVLLDTDEVIVPKTGTWHDLLYTLEDKHENATSFMARNVYFFDTKDHQHEYFKDVPRSLYMMQHVYRSKVHTKKGKFTKGFHNTDHVRTLHNHYPFSCINKCKSTEIDIEMAQLQHYRVGCPGEINSTGCAILMETIIDDRVWNFKEDLIESVNATLRKLDIDFD